MMFPKPDRKAERAAEKRLRAKLHAAWSKAVRTRDGGRCAWCGSVKRPQAHHIMSQAHCSDMGRYDIHNGMTLCVACHIFRLKRDPDGYLAMRDEYLTTIGTAHTSLQAAFGKRGKRKLGMWELSQLLAEFTRQNAATTLGGAA